MYQGGATRDEGENMDSAGILEVGLACLADWLCKVVKGR